MVFINYKQANLATGSLQAGISAAATSMILKAGEGGKFPSSYPYMLKIEKYDPASTLEIRPVIKREIVKVTNKVGDTFTIVRSAGYCPFTDVALTQTNTAASFDANDSIFLVQTAEDDADVKTELARLETDKVSINQYISGALLFQRSVTGNDSYAITLTGLTSYSQVDGQAIRFGADVANTGGATLNINGLGAKAITKFGGSALINSDIKANDVAIVIWNNAQDRFELESVIDQAASLSSDAFVENGTIPLGLDIGSGKSIYTENMTSTAEAVYEQKLGTGIYKRFHMRQLTSGVSGNTIETWVKKAGTPTDLKVRIETDAGGYPSGTLIDPNAYGTITAASITGSLSLKTVTLNSSVSSPIGTPVWEVWYVGTHGSETIATSDYYIFGMNPKHTSLRWNSINTAAGNIANYTIGNINLAAYASITTNVSAKESNMWGVSFSPDGTKMFVSGEVSNSVHRYDLSTPWDVSTKTFVSSKNTSASTGRVRGNRVSPDGTKMFIASDDIINGISQWTMSVAWDVTTMTHAGTYASGTSPFNVSFSSDGLKMYTISADNIIRQYILTTPYVITSGVSVSSTYTATGGGSAATYGMVFNPTGSIVYVTADTGDGIFQYALSTPWDISTASYVNTLNTGSQSSNPRGMGMNLEGTKILMAGQADVFQYNLQTTDYSYYMPYTNSTIFSSKLIDLTDADYLHKLPTDFARLTMESKLRGETVKSTILGINSQQTGLTIGAQQFISNTPGEISSTPGTYRYLVGVASAITAIFVDSKPLYPQVITTPASTVAWQNTTGREIEIAITGGTVTVISISKDGTNYFTKYTATNNTITLKPLDYMKLTWSVSPTVTQYFV